jgi:transcriptional regulator of aroF, aroG, tyrA and aromatic amino acid transport
MRLEITCEDRLGIAQDVLDILTNWKIDLRGIELDAIGKIFLNFPNVEFDELQQLMPQIRRISGVEDVKTIPFMPYEREQHQLKALLQTLPDPVFSIDTKGRILLANEAALNSLETTMPEMLGLDIVELLKGFNFMRWLCGKEVDSLAQKIKFIEQDFLADILPVKVAGEAGDSVLAGALIVLKSEFRLGQQLNVFHHAETDQFNHIQTTSSSMRKVVRETKKMAGLDESIMFYGETGVGKNLLAKSCHKASRRAGSPFIVFDCAGHSDQDIESKLLGIGLEGNTPSILEQCQHGTLLLDEVSALSLEMQDLLFRTINNDTLLKNGEKLDVRLISSTQAALSDLVEEGAFRERLFYRLTALNIKVPSLRERKQDIIPLAERILIKQSALMHRRVPKLSKSCVDFLTQYPWPGNVRQLENTLFQGIALLEGNEITKEDLSLPKETVSVNYVVENFEGSLDQEVRRFEKDLLKRLYPSYPSTRQLAKRLGLSHTAIANKLRDYGINKKSLKV